MMTGCIQLQVAPATLNRISSRSAGSVKRGQSRRAPARARLTASWRGGYQRYIQTLNLTINPADSTACQSKFNLLQINRGVVSGL